jgi:hydroxyacylglutathione hydrolase
MFSIFSIPAFNDNYIWALVDDDQRRAIIVDPGDATPVLAFLAQRKLTISAILITHKHHDHTGGISALLDAFPDAPVFANAVECVGHTTQTVSDGDVITINDYAFKVIAIPGHTLGHVAYYCKPTLFCGDTLFTNGCGRIFEGTAQQMLSSLKKLMTLPDDTLIYCGHEYTLSNIKFAIHIEPNNLELQNRFKDAKQLRSENQPTVPSTLKLEKSTNPFLRCDQSSVIEAVSHHAGKKLNSEVDVFAQLREWKNSF